MSEEISSIVEFSMDLNKQDAPEPLPSGKYTGVIRNAEVKESQRGTMYAAVSFHIGADQFPADYTDGNDDGVTLIYRRCGLEDNPQARYGAKRFIEAIGAPLSKKVDVAEWVGLEAALEVGHDTYEGVTRAVIDRVHAA
jgi:hypothetical protein